MKQFLRFNLFLSATSLVSCLPKSCETKNTEPTPTEKNAEALEQAAVKLTVDVNVTTAGLKLILPPVPLNVSFQCQLDGTAFSPCADGALQPVPTAGTHILKVTSYRDDRPIGEGELSFLIPSAGVENAGQKVAATKAPLGLELDDGSFLNGMPIPVEQPLSLPLRFQTQPACKVTFMCALSDDNTLPLKECKQIEKSTGRALKKNFSGDEIKLGLQYFKIQARCDKNAGPALSIFWYGVPENYAPLSIHVRGGRLELIRSLDCERGAVQFVCADSEQGIFSACEKTHFSLDDLPKIFARARCGDALGPVLSFSN